MKRIIITLLFTGALSFSYGQVSDVKLNGYIGQQIDKCIIHRVIGQDVDHLVEPFRNKTETRLWQSEFWGKWVQGAIASYRYNKDPKLLEMITRSAKEMMSTQLPNGYIGNYVESERLKHWDVWGNKYTCLGLIHYADLTGDQSAIDAACRVVDLLIEQLQVKGLRIAQTGNYFGMASSSILEPVVYLYNRTKNEKYLRFAHEIVSSLEQPNSAQLIAKTLAGVPVSKRSTIPKQWFSPANGMKAYEMMSCYEGMLELGKTTGDDTYRMVAEKLIDNIIADEINIAGSGASFECWYEGRAKQTLPTYHIMETCVTFTWMQLCNRMLRLTHNPRYADQLETTIYNALMASMKADASQISKYTPLEGVRQEGEEQCGMHINCCNANGPRAFAMIPDITYQQEGDQLFVNLYASSSATVTLPSKRKVAIKQTTDYPMNETIRIEVAPDKDAPFTLSLRIPAWSAKNSVKVNGVEQENYYPGSYLSIHRTWKKGDMVELSLDLRARIVEQNQHQAVVRGPIVLVRDSRYNDGFVDESLVIPAKDGFIEATPIAKAGFEWMAFSIPSVVGADLEETRTPKPIRFCDFASAGNTWEKHIRYRTWLPKTLNVQKEEYKPY